MLLMIPIKFIKYDLKPNPIQSTKNLRFQIFKEAFRKKIMKLCKFQYRFRNFKNKNLLKRKSKVGYAHHSNKAHVLASEAL